MSTLVRIEEAHVQSVKVTDDSLIVDLTDGRTIILPLSWYPRLWYGTEQERNHIEIGGNGEYIHWPDLDEDLSAEGLIAGYKSGESQKSLQKWLEQRKQEGKGSKAP